MAVHLRLATQCNLDEAQLLLW